MVILKTSTKYRKFFPNLVIKTTDFRLVLNFEQTRTFTIFGEHGIIRWAHTICLCNRLLFYSKRYWIYRLFYLQRYYNQWLQTSTHTELYLVSFQQIMFKLGKLTDFKEPLQLPCWQFSLAFSCSSKCAKTRRMGQENKTAVDAHTPFWPSLVYFLSLSPASQGTETPQKTGRERTSRRVPWHKLWFLIGSVAMLVMFSLFSFYLFVKTLGSRSSYARPGRARSKNREWHVRRTNELGALFILDIHLWTSLYRCLVLDRYSPVVWTRRRHQELREKVYIFQS